MRSKSFRKTIGYILIIFLVFLIVSGISYYVIISLQNKNNLMDIGDYSQNLLLLLKKIKFTNQNFHLLMFIAITGICPFKIYQS